MLAAQKRAFHGAVAEAWTRGRGLRGCDFVARAVGVVGVGGVVIGVAVVIVAVGAVVVEVLSRAGGGPERGDDER